MAPATATSVCVLCNLEVTENEHRREVDCPSKTCPGRVYHEDCIAAYLKRTKYSKDRCTGFPCPAILSTGKPCPGYVCKMHVFFPMNQKKKQARLEAAVANAALPKARPVPAKPKAAGAQVAIAAIKRAAPEGTSQPVAAKAVKPLANTTNANISVRPANSLKPAAQEQRIIPGLSGPVQDLSTREALRAQVAKLRSEAKATTGAGNNNVPNGGAQLAGAMGQAKAGVGIGGNAKLDLGFSSFARMQQNDEFAWHSQPPTLWDAFPKPQGLNKYIELAHHTRDTGGKFSSRLRKRLAGDSGKSIAGKDSASDCESDETVSTAGEMDLYEFQSGLSGGNSQLAISSEDYQAMTPRMPDSPADPTAAVQGSGADQAETSTAVVLADNDNDPIVEYDMVYGGEDGSHLVLDAVSNMYYLLTDMYTESAELVECMAEDGNMYTCVAVRQSQLERRTEVQRAWLEAQVDVEMPQAPAQMVATEADFGLPAAKAAAMPQYVYDSGMGATCASAAAAGAWVGLEAEEDDTDVDSLMQLLCV